MRGSPAPLSWHPIRKHSPPPTRVHPTGSEDTKKGAPASSWVTRNQWLGGNGWGVLISHSKPVLPVWSDWTPRLDHESPLSPPACLKHPPLATQQWVATNQWLSNEQPMTPFFTLYSRSVLPVWEL